MGAKKKDGGRGTEREREKEERYLKKKKAVSAVRM